MDFRVHKLIFASNFCLYIFAFVIELPIISKTGTFFPHCHFFPLDGFCISKILSEMGNGQSSLPHYLWHLRLNYVDPSRRAEKLYTVSWIRSPTVLLFVHVKSSPYILNQPSRCPWVPPERPQYPLVCQFSSPSLIKVSIWLLEDESSLRSISLFQNNAKPPFSPTVLTEKK